MVSVGGALPSPLADEEPLDAAIAVSVGQLRKGTPSGPDLQHVSPGAPCLDPSTGQTAALATLALLSTKLLEPPPPKNVDDYLHAEAPVFLPRWGPSKYKIIGGPPSPARRGRAASMNDHGGAAALRIGLLAGKRGRLLAGRLARIPEPTPARGRQVALRHVEAPPPPAWPSSPGRAPSRALSCCVLSRGAAGLLNTDGLPPAVARLCAGRSRAEKKKKDERSDGSSLDGGCGRCGHGFGFGAFGRNGTAPDTSRGLHACKAESSALRVTTGGGTGEE